MSYVADLLARVAVLENRLANTVLYGTITEADGEQGTCRVQAGELTTGWLPYALPAAGADVAIARTPSVGEQAIVLAPNGQTDNGLIIAGLATNNPGITDQPQGELTITANANVNIIASGNATITATDAMIAASGNATITAAQDIAIEGETINLTANPLKGEENINGGAQQCLGQLTPCFLTGSAHIPNPMIKTSIA
ncbi:MAG: phage baseplate assembly protein V [Alphaproteobacteria bacterium]|nr:phage baseplate assembly protein V [Alphaproteobacteria bacterium]